MFQASIRIYTIFVLLLLAVNSKAQTFEWVKFFTGKAGQLSRGLSADSTGNQYSVFSFDEEIGFDTSYLKTPYYRRALVLKQDANGKIIWFNIIHSNNSVVEVVASKFNSKGNYVVFVNSSDDLIIGSDTIKIINKSNVSYFMIEFNQSGKMVSGKILIEVFSGGGGLGNSVEIDKYDNLYLNINCKGKVEVYDKTGTTTFGSSITPTRRLIFKFSNSGQKLEWSKEFPDNMMDITSLKVDINGNVYVSGTWNSSNPFTFKGQTIYNPQLFTGVLFVFNKNGYDKSWFFVKASGKKSSFDDMVVYDSNSIFISGTYLGDSSKFDTAWKKNTRYGNYQFFARYSSNGKLHWVIVEDTSYSATFSPNISLGSITNYEDQHFYRSYLVKDTDKPVIYNGKKYNPDKRSSAGMYMKIDGRGNILWGFRTNASFSFMATDDYDNLYFQGMSNSDTIQFGKFKFKTPFDTCNPFFKYMCNDAFIGKTYDYKIYRGNISSGPYCAGDSLIVPYTIKGDFLNTNTFIAEISDEFGDFTGKEHEIGRLKSKDSGTIRGVLPLIKIASSANYRIRVRSTFPEVQSFYKKDTLRLLIYSRDKANPGPPQLVCRGDTISLSTYGGTKWKWTPNYNIDDQNKRQPKIWPEKDTVYQIIISDSSGCGAPDTAYKQIYVRPGLKAVLSYTDTSVCDKVPLTIPVSFKGGDSTGYKYSWYFVYSLKSWFTLRSGKSKFSDTFSYTPPYPVVKLAVVLSDDCTAKKDTAYVTIHWRSNTDIKTTFRDTTLCNGQTLQYNVSALGGMATKYRWQWKDVLSNTVLSTADTLKIVTSKTLKIQLIVNDGCEALGDTAMFEVKVKTELKAITNLRDTTLCSGKTIIYKAAGKGGNTTDYKFNWYLNNNLIDTGTTLTSTLALTSTLTLILKDNCSKNDTITKTITVKPSPKADFTWDLACSKTITKFQFTGTKPTTPITTSLRWNFNNEAISSIENPSHKFLSVGTSTSTLTLNSSNGCNDTLKKTIDIRPQSKADFTANDVCETDSAVFINNSVDATSYNWRFGDGLKSTKMSPKHLYNIGGITKTYNVSLVAVVKDGCSDSIIKAISINSNPNSNFTYTLTGAKLDLKATVQGNTKYRWKFDATDSATTTSGNYTHYFTKPGLHNICLKVFNLAECTSQSCQSMTVGISTIAKPSGFNIYPNPNTGNFTIEIDNPTKDVYIEVYDLLGKLIKTIETESSKKSYSIDINSADGIYVVRVSNGGMVWNRKVSVLR